MIGENIKKLRKAKGMTQEELAQVLCVSYQAVSKWENGGSPDLDMLPALANTFGVTIDELMGFKLQAYTNKEKFIRLMADAGVLKRGHFDLHGFDADYYVDSEHFTTNIHLAKLGEFFADLIMEEHLEFDCIVGLAYHGISFAAATAMALAGKYGVTANYCHDRKQPDSRGRILCGHTLENGERVIIVDDLINSGKTVIERIERLNFEEYWRHNSKKGENHYELRRYRIYRYVQGHSGEWNEYGRGKGAAALAGRGECLYHQEVWCGESL